MRRVRKRRHSRETPLWQRQRNPFCPSLSPRGTAEPAEGTSNLYMPTAPQKKSVREELREIQAGRNQKKRNQPVSDRVQQRGRRQQERVLEHRQPQNRKVKKTSKER